MTPSPTPLQHRLDRLSQGLMVATFLTFPVALALGNVLAALCLVCSLLSRPLRARWRQVLQRPSAWAMLLLFALVLLGTSYTSAPPATAVVHLLKYAKLLLALVFMAVLMDTATRRHCLYAFMAAMGFVLASAYASIWVPLPWSATQQTGLGVDHTVVGDYITQSVMMTFFVLACLARAGQARAGRARAGWVLVALLGAISITHLAWGRTGVFVLASALVVAGLAVAPGRRKLWVLGGVLALMALVAASSPLLMGKVRMGWQEVQNHENNRHTSLGHRLYNYQSALTLARQHPLLGSGTGSFETEACLLPSSPANCQEFGWHPHNQYLFFLVENGIGAMLLFVLLIASLFHAARPRSTPDKFLLLGLATALAADSLINSPLFSARESHFFILMIALLVAGPVMEPDSATAPTAP